MQKSLEIVPLTPPPVAQRVRRDAAFATEGEKRNRYHLPRSLESSSPVGFRTRVAMSHEEVASVLPLLSLSRPEAFVPPETSVSEQELFEEASLGVMSSRQSTNFRGHRQVTLGGPQAERVKQILRQLDPLEAPVLEHAEYVHIGLSRPYRTPFTFLLTFIGHRPFSNLWTVAQRALRKRLWHANDIPTIGYLQHLHVGIWADAMERAAVVASEGRRRAQVFMAPFADQARRDEHPALMAELETLAGLTAAERRLGWRIHLVAQVGTVATPMVLALSTWRKLGANLLSFRSERIQPGVNAEAKAPGQYQSRQDMDVPDDVAVMAGRAAYNAFAHWTGGDREAAKDALLIERVDVLTDGGKERLRSIRKQLGDITDLVCKYIPLWADLPVGRALTRNAMRGKKAFALAGQRIYIGGLDRDEVARLGLHWNQAVRAFGAAAARSSLYCELLGVTDLPDDCDMLAGVCLMAGPVNQNDIGKAFYGYPDLLQGAYPGRDTTSLLVWTLKAKTVADPVGNEEQLLNAKRKGALVDLRAGPHEVVQLHVGGQLVPMRSHGGQVSTERAFGDVGNFVTDAAGCDIPGNRGEAWPHGADPVWS